MDDTALDARWAEVVGGSRAALAAVHQSLAPGIFGYAARLVGNDALGEEIAQETFLMALKRAAQYRGPQRLRFWLFGIAHRLALDALAREQRHRRLVAFGEGASSGDPPLVDAEGRACLRDAVEELPVAERTVLLMRVYLELSFADIAALLDIPVNTALGRMHTALRRLRDDGKIKRYFSDEMPAD
jgi:RNA polymerase sigma-70 factor (ECF subfamily)